MAWSRLSSAAVKLGARALFLLGLSGIYTGCSSNSVTPTPAVTEWVYFHEIVGGRERYLNVQPDGSYESAVLDEHTVRKGQLTDAQIARLKELTSEAQFDTYLAESEPDCEATDSDIAVQTVVWREEEEGAFHAREGCWVRMSVENHETQVFLDAISALQRDLAQ